ncbi:MAG TPA: zinc-binding alcohol dehydrogenase family protein [Gemmatimonadaceae bacterium]|nr:zinc-binding alcohol dehydrogenase family protein [Gemmatimonadaceae bacterium]
MRALQLRRPAPAAPGATPLELVDVEAPVARDGEIVVKVSVCGVCRTDLDVVEGRVVAPRYPVIPGHQAVGRVATVGNGVTTSHVGDRVGVAWIHWADGTCRWCRAGLENLCPKFVSTGADVNGGYAEFVAVPAAFAHPIPEAMTDVDAAPLLCAGAIGWRSLRLANLSRGERLGLVGFGASGHLVLQLARHRHPDSPIFVFARNPEERAFARQLGAAWTGDTSESPPAPVDAIIDTTPAWKPIVDALGHLEVGGRLIINAIRKSDADKAELLRLDYARHLWMERVVRSVANVTRVDVRETLAAAASIPLRPTVQLLPLADANVALARLHSAAGMRGAMVLKV